MTRYRRGAAVAGGLLTLALAGCRPADPAAVDGQAGPIAGATQATTTAAPSPSAAPVPVDLPAGFLLHEAEAAADPRRGTDDLDYWTSTNATAEPWLVQPCAQPVRYASDAGRTAARTVRHGVADAATAEQVIVYRDAQAAVAAMAELRATVQRCASRATPSGTVRYTVAALAIGGEAIRVTGDNATPAELDGDELVVVRRGAALALYGAFGEVGHPTATSTAPYQADAVRMADKLCRYTLAGC
jgi:hypothetical protein